MIRTKEDLKYFQTRQDIVARTLITAFNRSEAWRKGKDALES